MGTDGWIYKGPGCALAQGDGLTARYLPASISDQPKLYAIYTPGLALAFALPAWIGGCSPLANSLFNLVVGVAGVALLLPLALAPFASRRGRALLTALLLLLVPAGLTALDPDRGEPLALACLLGALRLLMARPTWRPLAYSTAGLAALCLPIAGPIGGLALLSSERLLLPRADRPRGFLAAAGSAFGWFLLPLAIWATIWWLLDPTWHERFLLHSAGQDAGPGVYWLAADPLGYFLQVLREIYLGDPVKALRLLSAVAPLLVVVWSCLQGGRPERRWLGLMLLLSAAVLFGLVYQPSYLFLTIALLSAITLALCVPRQAAGGARLATLLLLSLPLLGNSPGLVGDVVARSLERPAWQQVEILAPAFVAAARPSAPERMLMVPASHFLLFRQFTDAVVVDHFWIPPLATRLVGLATCATSQLPEEAGPPRGPAAALAWLPWGETLVDRRPLLVLGQRLRHRLTNWSCQFWLRAS